LLRCGRMPRSTTGARHWSCRLHRRLTTLAVGRRKVVVGAALSAGGSANSKTI
jgi:hypothetical protein